jgi:hypothetical protein
MRVISSHFWVILCPWMRTAAAIAMNNDTYGRGVCDTAVRNILLECGAAKGEMTRRRIINHQSEMDSMKKSDDVRRIQMRRDTEIHEGQRKTEAEIREELRGMGGELMKLKKLQDVLVDNITKIQAAKDALTEIEGETVVVARAARNDEIRRFHCALASQMSASVGILNARDDIVGEIRDAQPPPWASSHPAMIPPLAIPFTAKNEVSFRSMPASTTLELSAIGGDRGDDLSDKELWLSDRRRLQARPEWNKRFCINDPKRCHADKGPHAT